MTDEELDDFVEGLVEEAMGGLEAVLLPAHFEAVRSQLEHELMFTEEGRKLVRQAMSDPRVQKSADVRAKGTATQPTAAEETPAKKAGGDGGK